MEYSTLWTVGLTALLGVFGWALRATYAEIQRMQILLNRTREEIPREYVTKAELRDDMSRVINRLEALDAKLDRIIESR